MKVTIDTKEDSHEDIHKVLQILTSILERKGNETTISNNTPEPDTTPLMSMFNDEPSKEIKDKAPDFSSFLNLADTTKKKENNEPKIEFY